MPADRREANRLRSERYRRAHGTMPRKPAQKPWLAEGVSRSTWYRRGGRIGTAGPGRGKKTGSQRTGFKRGMNRAYIVARLERDAAQLQAELAEAARCHAIAAAIIGELMA